MKFALVTKINVLRRYAQQDYMKIVLKSSVKQTHTKQQNRPIVNENQNWPPIASHKHTYRFRLLEALHLLDTHKILRVNLRVNERSKYEANVHGIYL